MRQLGLIAVVVLSSCRESAAAPRPDGTRTIETPKIVTEIYSGGLVRPWEDHGWCDRAPREAGPEKLLMGNYGGWILANSKLVGTFGGLVFRFKAPREYGNFLQVRVDSESESIYPRVDVEPSLIKELPDGWSEVLIPMSALNPGYEAFTRVVFRAKRKLPAPGLVEIDLVGLTLASPEAMEKASAPRQINTTPAAMSVDCSAPTREISPLIYGIAFSARAEYQSDHQWKLGATARRWGGNPTSRFNWELGNAWNTASDYFFENVDYVQRTDFTWASFLEVDRDRQISTALTVPMLGWVAKDKKSNSYPVDLFGKQQQVDGDRNAGNGVTPEGKNIEAGDPARTSVVAPPEFIARWVEAINAISKKRGSRVVQQYILDNEPGLWHDTHRDVHPRALTYDELLDRTIRYGSAIRKADPEALIAGPAEWGWTGYLYSALDAEKGFDAKPDRKAHQDQPLIEWYLKKLAEHEKKTGVKVLDVLDLHYYPQGKGIGVGTDGRTDRDTNALRIRSTRSLWDPRYSDESWIKEPVQLIPRMRAWSDTFYPGLKLSIGEYNFGAEGHMSGGLALAEALGRFGEQGLYSAFYWTYPPEGSPAAQAFRAFRDFDGKGAAFQSLSMPAQAPRDTSIFAARSRDGKTVTLVLLNFSPNDGFDASVKLKGCEVPSKQRVFTSLGDARGFQPQEAIVGRPYHLPPYSMTVVELGFDAPLK